MSGNDDTIRTKSWQRWISLLLLSLFFSVSHVFAQVPGCTDPLATNYNPAATVNDGSCTYAAATVTPYHTVNLPAKLNETSGLILWNQGLWTHNDNSDSQLYILDTLSGTITQTVLLELANTDWEEIAQDESYLYVGDIGNNANGNRTDLRIYRISKESVLAGNPVSETIGFSYSDQSNYNPAGANNTNFDCEAFIVSSDSIYLFTKRWLDEKTAVYALPKEPGNYVAQFRVLYDVDGLVTGATFLEDYRLVALSGYSSSLQPFIFLLYDFTGNEFFGGNKRKISVGLPFHQVEGIATGNGLKFYLTNEKFYQPPVFNVQQKMHNLDMSAYLGYYLRHLNTGISLEESDQPGVLYPSLTSDLVHLVVGQDRVGSRYGIFNASGIMVDRGKIRSQHTTISMKNLNSGWYWISLFGNRIETMRFYRR